MEEEEVDRPNTLDSSRPKSCSDDGEFDDELGLPEPIDIIDIGEGIVAIEDTFDEDEHEKISGFNFATIHKRPVKFTSLLRETFLPNEDITAVIIDIERNFTTHILNPNLYTISLSHGAFDWKIKKRYKQFQSLHQQLVMFRTSLNIPFPSKTHRIKRKSFKLDKENAKKKKKNSLPRFPKKPEVLISYDKLDARKQQLEDYLNSLLNIKIYRNHPATAEFLEVSNLSFISGLGVKRKEGIVKKRNGSTQAGQAGCNCLGIIRSRCCRSCQHMCNDVLCARWVDRWFFVKDSYYGYINPNDGKVRAVILFDQGFEVSSGLYTIGLHTGFQVTTLSRHIAFKCWTKRKSKEWVEALKEVASTTARDFVLQNRYRSFAPPRPCITCSWFVDGASYMSSVAEAIDQAKEEIFIADWWLSPEIYLKRPAIYGHRWRLDVLLKKKASEGVKIFILLYKEVELALGLNSYYSKQTLTHENIRVLRHPDHAKVGIFLWAHHEKVVVIDQNYAFLGGVDLCYGRWDDQSHRLTDLGSVTPMVDVNQTNKSSSNPMGNATSVTISVQPPIPKIIEPETPLSIQELPQLEPGDHLLMPNSIPERMKCNTPELERKSVLKTIKKTVKRSKNLVSLVYTSDEETEYKETEFKSSPRSSVENLNDLDGSCKYWIGKDYVNFIVQDFNKLDEPFTDFINRNTTPRMPWHDIGMCVQGNAAKDVARHFIQRWNATKLEKAKNHDCYEYLLPKSPNEFRSLNMKFPFGAQSVSCQVLRSVSSWSCGFLESDTIEQSILEAYIDTITRAQHYIYIENQFFISQPYNNLNVKNRIADELYKRIIRAYKAKETFRVFVVMPLLPGFEGEVGETTGTSLHAITHWNYASISRGKDAILNRLKQAGIKDPLEYISFYGLRTHSRLNNEPITELIYVHSKLMIVDDRIVICGSANINDRSLLGKRDSEIAVIIEDEHFSDGIMNGKPFPFGKFAGSLRKTLFKEHLGLLEKNKSDLPFIDITDPVSDFFYKKVWYETAVSNTILFEKVFSCIPSDEVQTFADVRHWKQEKPYYTMQAIAAEKMLGKIQGHLVLLPLNFLCKELLTPAVSSMEGMMPTSLWT